MTRVFWRKMKSCMARVVWGWAAIISRLSAVCQRCQRYVMHPLVIDVFNSPQLLNILYNFANSICSLRNGIYYQQPIWRERNARTHVFSTTNQGLQLRIRINPITDFFLSFNCLNTQFLFSYSLAVPNSDYLREKCTMIQVVQQSDATQFSLQLMC